MQLNLLWGISTQRLTILGDSSSNSCRCDRAFRAGEGWGVDRMREGVYWKLGRGLEGVRVRVHWWCRRWFRGTGREVEGVGSVGGLGVGVD